MAEEEPYSYPPLDIVPDFSEAVGTRKTQEGDVIQVHYRGTLQANGKKFDSSYDRGDPLEFTVGQGQVIQGWDKGLLQMKIGEKRTITIPPALGYGQSGAGNIIPGNATLIFETELVGIKGVNRGE